MTTDVVRPTGNQLIVNSKAPEALARIVNLEGWARAIVYGEKYTEVDPDFISRKLALEIITSGSVEEAFEQSGIKGVQSIVPNKPGGTTGPIEITDLYVTESDFEQGNSCFLILDTVSLETGEQQKMTTGATNIQATMIAVLNNGMWPIRCQFKRGDQKDRGGKYLLFMLPPD